MPIKANLRSEPTGTALTAWMVAEAVRKAAGVAYVDPFPFQLVLDAAGGNADAIAILAQREAGRSACLLR